jgi:hypothetical protein
MKDIRFSTNREEVGLYLVEGGKHVEGGGDRDRLHFCSVWGVFARFQGIFIRKQEFEFVFF